MERTDPFAEWLAQSLGRIDPPLAPANVAIFADLLAGAVWGLWFVRSYLMQHPGDALLFVLALLLVGLRLPTAYLDLRERLERRRKKDG